MQEHQAIWRSNLIVSDIPWEYYLHPCPIFMRRNFQFTDLHFGLIPPPEIQRKQNSFAKQKFSLFTPLILKRSGKDSGFGKLEVKLQTRLVTSLFLDLRSKYLFRQPIIT